MKNSPSLMLIGLCLCGLLWIPSSNAVFNKTNPQNNINLAPFIQHQSAYYCLLNVSSDCPGNFTLKGSGWLNISANQKQAFCDGGCAQHTKEVLKCVSYVKHDYVFENKATIKNINDTINIGCTQGFNGTSLTSGTGMATTASIVATFTALAFFALFYM